MTGVHLGIKWPNDLMLGTRKVGGILCEARWQGSDLGWIAIGVGLNLSNPLSTAIAELAATLMPAPVKSAALASFYLIDKMVVVDYRSIPVGPLFRALIASLAAWFRSRVALQLEIRALRHQIGVLQRSVKRPKLTVADRLLCGLALLCLAGLAIERIHHESRHCR